MNPIALMTLGLSRPHPLPPHIRQQPEAYQRPAAPKYRMLTVTEVRTLVRESLESGPGTTADVAGYCGTTCKVVRGALESMVRAGEVIRAQREGTAKLSYLWSLVETQK